MTLILCLDEYFGCAICWIHEVNVFGRSPRRVDGKHGKGMLQNLRQGVDGALFEEDELAGADLPRSIVGDGDLGGSREDVEVLVTAGVEVCGNGAVDAKTWQLAASSSVRRMSASIVCAVSGSEAARTAGAKNLLSELMGNLERMDGSEIVQCEKERGRGFTRPLEAVI